ncbi:MAG: helix-turn-helix domain-containing protein [Acetobacteraceae bacterium]
MAKQSRTDGEYQEEIVKYLKGIARRLFAARKKSGLTQAQLGERAGVKQSYIFELEQGTTNITVGTLVKMASVLDLDPRELLPGKPMPALARADVRDLKSMLDRLATAIEERIEQEKRRSRKEAEFLTELGILDSLRDVLGLRDGKTASPP